jgi:adenylylsulfate kinase-like enzyme
MDLAVVSIGTALSNYRKKKQGAKILERLERGKFIEVFFKSGLSSS